MRLIKQIEYCEKKGLDMFAPSDGVCWGCRKQIEDSGERLITGCSYCYRSYVD